MGLRQEKKQRIIDACIASLDKLGARKKYFDQIHVDRVCEDVGISKVTLFKYFKTKEHLLLAWWERQIITRMGSSLDIENAIYMLRTTRTPLFDETRAQMFGRLAVKFRYAFPYDLKHCLN